MYDAAALSAITLLRAKSVALGNETVEFPDFTSGNGYTENQCLL
jgi:hypothetical protein